MYDGVAFEINKENVWVPETESSERGNHGRSGSVGGYMRVVTISGFGRMAPESNEVWQSYYEGNASLFRFTIESPNHFFEQELNNLVWEVFKIDPRQIYHMCFFGD